MKSLGKGSLFIFIILGVVLLVGCKAPLKLEEGQYFQTFNNDGSARMSIVMSADDAEEIFGFDLNKDDKEDIEEEILEKLEEMDTDIELRTLKVTEDYLKYTLIYEDGEDILGYDLNDTLEDYADDYYGMDLETLAEDIEFIYYKDGEEVDEDHVTEYEDARVMTAYGSTDGAYFRFPGKILILGEIFGDLEYEKISSNTIYVEEDVEVLVVYEEE